MLIRKLFAASAPAALALFSALALPVQAGDVLETSGFTTCLDSSDIVVNNMYLKYDRDTGLINFNLGGISTSEQNVTARVKIKAYGKEYYATTFDACEKGIKQLCPSAHRPRLCVQCPC